MQKGQLVIFVDSSFYRSKRPHKIRSNNGGVSYLELNEPCMVSSKLNKFEHVWGGTWDFGRGVDGPCMVKTGGAGARGVTWARGLPTVTCD